MGLSSWIWTFGSALPSGKMAKFSLGKVTVKDSKLNDISEKIEDILLSLNLNATAL